MSISSIHIEAGHAGYLAHNDRSQATVNSIFKDEKNETSLSAKDAFKLYRAELKARTEAYTARTNQKLQKKAVTHLSAIVNLNKEHTLKDLEKLKEYLEKTLDTKVFQVAIHRDEGHINDKKEAVKNYHAHIEFMGLDSTGQSVRRKLTRSYLKKLQTKTAEILQMQRGKENSKAKRLDTYEYKNHKEKEAKTVKELKAEFENFRKEMLEKNKELENKVYSKEDYQALQKLKKELKKSNLVEIAEEFEKLKKELQSKDITIAVMQESINDLREELSQKDNQIEILEKKVETLERDSYELSYDQEMQEPIFVHKDEIITELKNARSYLSNEVQELNKENITLKSQNTRLKAKISTLDSRDTSEELKTLKIENKSLKEENKIFREMFEHIKKLSFVQKALKQIIKYKNFDLEKARKISENDREKNRVNIIEKVLDVFVKEEKLVKFNSVNEYVLTSKDEIESEIINDNQSEKALEAKSAFEKLEQMQKKEKKIDEIVERVRKPKRSRGMGR
jgi:hypothetical protein